MKIEKVLIIGGGIGGLTLAIALHRAGIPCTVFERAPELKEVGAGVGVWANAVKVLDRLGVGDSLREIGMPLAVAELCSDTGRVLSAANLTEVVREAGAACYVLHRAELHAALAEQLPEGAIKTDHECVGLEETGAGVTAHFANGASAEGTLVVGADGINSVVRAQLWGREKPRFSGQTAFRAVVKFDVPDKRVMREAHGAGKRFGICPMSKDRIYWYAAFNAPEGRMIDFDKRQKLLLEEYKDWCGQAPDIIAATPSETILQNDLVDRVPIKRWSKGAITLLGDAAHPTTPNFGQGACMAIEDAMVLTRNLLRHANLRDALQSYEGERAKRTTSIVKQSWAFGMLARVKNPLVVRVRELLVRATPEFLIQQTLRSQAGFDAGDLS
ncbi:MAG: FAD-dependent monooxygenase [Rubrivivax sp.]|nr:FAD-dependent monooxygenase [Pyrinomonadaceae bacterium]